MRSEFVVVSKEFRDYLGGRRFMLLFGLLGLLTIIGAVTGINNYNSDLQRVASAAWCSCTGSTGGDERRDLAEMPFWLIRRGCRRREDGMPFLLLKYFRFSMFFGSACQTALCK
jgi:hypothetical protein